MQTPTPASLQAWTALLSAHRHLTIELDRELRERSGLSLDEYDVLLQLRSLGATTMSELSSRLLISRPSTTRVVGRLVERGLVRRTDDDLDRRVVRVGLTPEGLRVHSRAARVHLDGIARLVGDPLTSHDAAAVAAALEALHPR